MNHIEDLKIKEEIDFIKKGCDCGRQYESFSKNYTYFFCENCDAHFTIDKDIGCEINFNNYKQIKNQIKKIIDLGPIWR